MTISALKNATHKRSNSRLNFLCCLSDAGGWPLGIAFFAPGTLAALFLARLHASNFLIGLLPALVSFGYFAPGLLVAGMVSRMEHAKGWLLKVSLLERVPFFLIAALTALWGVAHPAALIVGFFILYGIHALCTGLNQPAYWVVISKTIPTLWRGRLYGYAGLISGVLGFGVEPVAHYFLRGPSGGFPMGFADCFLVGAAITFICVLPLGLIREPATDHVDDPHTGHYKQDGLRLLRQNAGLRRFLYYQAVAALRAAATPFFLLACISRFHVGTGAVAAITGINVVAASLGAFLCGAWADRRGNKQVLALAQVVVLAACVLAIFAPSVTAFYLVVAAAALGGTGVLIAGFNMAMEMAPAHRDIPLYTSVNNAVTGLFATIAPLAGGLLSDKFGYDWAFALAALASLVSLVIAFGLHEPRRRPLNLPQAHS